MVKKVYKMSASWCMPCKVYAPVFESVSKLDEYKDIEYRVDPIGPDKGKYGQHVLRSYSQEKGKLRRSYGELDHYFRLAIKVKDVIDKIK